MSFYDLRNSTRNWTYFIFVKWYHIIQVYISKLKKRKDIVSQEMKKCLSILGCTGRFIKYSLNKNSNECHDDIKTFWKWFKSLIQLLSNKSDMNFIQIT